MKRYTQVALAILLVGFTSESCKKESFPGVEKFENLLSLSSPAQMRIAFNELTATEKADFWKYNLRKKMDGLTGVQRNLISEIYAHLTPGAYESGSSENIRLKTLIVPEWLKKAESVFSQAKLWELFYFHEGEKVVNVIPIPMSWSKLNQLTQYIMKVHPIVYAILAARYTCKKREISVGTTGITIKEIYGSCSYTT